ncbi:hypothetical protein RB195_018412 [Necator americanus]|uniref:Uncharacterized protein n=1 Tax=Necator americanus TaxID=51031 RepID=A0ABR1CAU3_NECAM
MEPGVSSLFHYILDALIRFPSRSSPSFPARRSGRHRVQFPTQINVAGAFGYVRSAEREWGIRDPSVAHGNHLLQIQLKTDACFVLFGVSCFVKFGQHSFRLADARCYQYDVISEAQMV